MNIELTVVNEVGEVEKFISNLNKNTLSKVIEAAKELDLSCLQFISLEGGTIFNDLQALEICRELEILKGVAGIERYFLNLIKEAALEVLDSLDSYIRFKVLD